MAGSVRKSFPHTRTRTRIRSLPSGLLSSSRILVPEDPDEFDTPSDYLSALSTGLMGCQFLAGQFYLPGLTLAFEAAIRMIKSLRDLKMNFKEFQRLIMFTSNYTRLLMEHAEELSSIPSASIRMRELEEQLISFVRILSRAEDTACHMVTRNVFAGLLRVNTDKEEFQRLEKRLEHALNTFQTRVLSHIDRNVYRVLDGLGALHDRIDNTDRNVYQVLDRLEALHNRIDNMTYFNPYPFRGGVPFD